MYFQCADKSAHITKRAIKLKDKDILEYIYYIVIQSYSIWQVNTGKHYFRINYYINQRDKLAWLRY